MSYRATEGPDIVMLLAVPGLSAPADLGTEEQRRVLKPKVAFSTFRVLSLNEMGDKGV
jgi:hypothetical protein